MVMAGLGVGPSLPLFTLAIQNAVDVRFIGQATSASQFFRQTGATMGAAVMGAVLATTLGVSFAAIELPPPLLQASDASAARFVSTGGAGLPDQILDAYERLARDAVTTDQATELRLEGERAAASVASQVRAAFALATSRIYWLTAIVMALAAVLVLRIPELPLRTTHDRAEAAATEP